MKYGIAFMIIRLLLNEMHKYSITNDVHYRHQLGAGLSASRRAWERVPLHQLLKTHKNQILQS